MKSLFPWSVLMLSLSLVVGCGGSSGDDDEEPEPGLEVATVSGVTIDLSGRSFITACETVNGEGQLKGLYFSRNKGVRENVTYPSSGGSCTGSYTVTGAYTSEYTSPTPGAITGWQEGSAPQAADGMDALSDQEAVTFLDQEVVARSGSGVPSVGETGTAFFVVDDTALDDNGCLVLYRNFDSQYATAADVYTNGNCP